MKEKKKYIVILVFTLFVGFFSGVSYAYFTVNITEENKENKETNVATASFVDVTMDYGSKIEASGVLPGHKEIKTVHVTGTGEESSIPVTIAVTLTPYVENFKNHVRYTIYEVENSSIKLEDICENTNNVNDIGKYYDDMECDTTSLGNAIKTGIFEDEVVESMNVDVKYNTDKTIYVLVEYINDEFNPQDEEQGKSFTINIGYSDGVDHPNLGEYLIEKSNRNDATIVKVNHGSTIQTGEEARVDYRYVGANPNNYVYFGCEENCTEDNLYRIIGVIPVQSSADGPYENRVKLIKASNWEGITAESGSAYTSSGKGYRWNTFASNKWEESTLQKILNGEYYISLGEYQKFIEQTKWYLGAIDKNNFNLYTAEQFYTMERSNTLGYSKGGLFYITSVGLMYPSDYGYSLDCGDNKEILNNKPLYENRENYYSNAWLYLLEGKYCEWTISPDSKIYSSTEGVLAWALSQNAYVGHAWVSRSTYTFGVRPTFYLKKNVILASGEGSVKNPYRITIS